LRSLRTKLVLYMSLLVAGLVGVAGFVEVRKRSSELNTELLENAQNFSAISAGTVLDKTRELYYQPDKFTELESSVRQVMRRHRALSRVEVVETLFGIVLFDSKEFEEGYYGFDQEPRVFSGNELLRNVELNKLVVDRKGQTIRVMVPLFSGKEIADPRDVNRGVVFHFSTAQVEKALADMRLRYFLQALVFVLIGVVLAAFESNAITRPLRGLTEGAQRISQGDLDHRVKVGTKDELGVLGDNFNAMAGSLKQSRDDLVLALERLEAQNVELKELDKLKDQFLANTSHELRTPINGILGLIGAVLDGADGPLNPKQAHHLRMVKESGERLKNLITNILDFSKLKSGKEKFELIPFRLSDLASHVSGLAEGLLRGKTVTIAVELPESLPAVYGDSDRVMQVLTNLVGNAAKFTEKGHVRVYAEPRDGHMVIAVEDTGPGIPDDAKQYLFQEFRQVDGSSSRNYEGTGLGLAIAKQLVNKMGGQIDFRSEAGKGTVFFFTLPMREGDVPVSIATQEKGTQAQTGMSMVMRSIAGGVIGGTEIKNRTDTDLSPLRGNGEVIAVVDDIPANVEALKILLEDNGYTIFTAKSGPELLTLMETQKVHLVLADVRMPGMEGTELCRRIRGIPALAKTPVFLVTAQAATAQEVHAATECGADAYVLKPFEPVALLERIHSVLKPKPEIPRGKGQRVLVVDDRQVAAQGLAMHLHTFGYQPVVVTKPNEVIEVCGKEKPDLAIIDIRMGEVSGYEVVQQLRADARFTRMPVIMVSGMGSPSDRLRTNEVGAQEFIPKPFAVEDVMSRLAFHLKRAGSEKSMGGQGQKILVVDDVEVNVEALATQLEHRGFVALRALNGMKALELARAEKPQVVVSDVMMPGMTGYDLCRELQKDPEAGSPPVILLTAQGGSLQDKLLGFDAGAVDYVVKPFEPEELMARVGKLISRGPAPGASHTGITRVVEPIYETAAETSAGLNIRGAGELVMCVDDNPINLEVLKTNLEAVNYRTLLAKDGMDALEKLEKHAPELILLDVMMPRMTGYQFIERMRQNPKFKDIPVVIVSAKDRPEDSLSGFKHGVVDYVTKPFNPSLVAAKVAAIIALRRAQSALGTINAELNVARLVQQASFPEPILDLPNFAVRGIIQCADTSGGDWYGYFTSPGQDRLTLIAGDVTGHGISAALVALAVNSIKSTMELVEGMLDTSRMAPRVLASLEGKVPANVHQGFARLLQVPHSPSAMAGLINEVFCYSKSFLRMTAQVLCVDLPKGEVTYTIAGAPKPLHLRRSQKTPGFWEVGALSAPASAILGHSREAKYTEQKLLLQPGEAVLVYSDGITEAENAQGQQFGNRRMVQAYGKKALPNAVPDAMVLRDTMMEELFKFTGDAPLKDDITVVIAQRLLGGQS
jgi:DNA-binding response OmpR family regulator/signal transduction histidine kinase